MYAGLGSLQTALSITSRSACMLCAKLWSRQPAGTNVSHSIRRVEEVFEIVHNSFRNFDCPDFGTHEKSTLFAHVIHRLIHSLCINRPTTGDNHDCMEEAMKNSSVCKDYHNRLADAGTV
jgi:hypothetical protein